MADVTVASGVHSTMYLQTGLFGPFWTSTSVGYVLSYTTTTLDIMKTTDAGATWSAVDVDNNPVQEGALLFGTGVSAWFDRNTPGNTGSRIHVVYRTDDPFGHRYTFFDVATDKWKAAPVFIANPGAIYTGLTVSVDGTIHLLAANGATYRSHDGGETWVAAATRPGQNFTPASMRCFPAGTDDADIWAVVAGSVFDGGSRTVLALDHYDGSADEWAARHQLFQSSESILATIGTATLFYSGAIRHSDGHLLVVAGNSWDDATTDLLTWDIEDLNNVTAMADVVTDSDDVGYPAIFVNQQNDDVYVAYCGTEAGTDTIHSLVGVYYKVSTDDMASWGSQTQYHTTRDDYKAIDTGMGVSAGGRFMPAFFDDDDDLILVNDGNDVAIAGSALAWVDGALPSMSGGLASAHFLQHVDLTGAFGFDHPTVLETITETADDGCEASGIGLLTDQIFAGNIEGSSVDAFFRFQGFTAEQGSTPTVFLSTGISFLEGSPDLTVRGVDADDAAAFADPGNLPSNATLTTAGVAFAPSGLGQYDLDISPIVAEVLARGGWSSGNDLAFIITDNANNNEVVGLADFEDGFPAQLLIPSNVGVLTERTTAKSLAGILPAQEGEIFSGSGLVRGDLPAQSGALASHYPFRQLTLAGSLPAMDGALAFHYLFRQLALAGDLPAQSGALTAVERQFIDLAGSLPAMEGSLRSLPLQVRLSGLLVPMEGSLRFLHLNVDLAGELPAMAGALLERRVGVVGRVVPPAGFSPRLVVPPAGSTVRGLRPPS